MKQTARRTGYTTLLPSALAASLSLSLCGCAWLRPKPLLGTRDGMVPPPYQTPAVPPSTTTTASAEPMPVFPEQMPTGAVFTQPTEAVTKTIEVVPTEGDKECPPNEIMLPKAPEIKQISYTVKKNENLWVIARKYGITYQELAATNGLDPNAVLSEGKVLLISPGGRPGAASEQRSGTVREGNAGRKPVITAGAYTYTVERGDCLSEIASRCSMKTVDLRKLNGLQGDTIYIGQKLKVRGKVPAKRTTVRKTPTPPEKLEKPTLPEKPEKPAVTDIPPVPAEGDGEVDVKPQPEPPPKAKVADLRELPHDICKDDTLENIAEIYGTTVNAILQANPKVRSDADLVEGKTIMVPYK